MTLLYMLLCFYLFAGYQIFILVYTFHCLLRRLFVLSFTQSVTVVPTSFSLDSQHSQRLLSPTSVRRYKASERHSRSYLVLRLLSTQPEVFHSLPVRLRSSCDRRRRSYFARLRLSMQSRWLGRA